MRRLLIASALSAVGLTLAACDPYYYGPGPGPLPDGGPPPGDGGYGPPGGYPPGPPPPGAQISVLGCPIPGAEYRCTGLRAADGGMFDISSADPRPDPRGPYAIELTGRVSQRMSYCQQGVILEDVQWRTTHLRCVQGALQR